MEMVEGEILPSKLDKCCFRYDLTLGCAVYVTVEVYLWAIMSIASIYSEFKMIENNDLEAFKTFTINSSYYVTIFGNYSDDISNGIICKSSKISKLIVVAIEF
ncbi:CLUMA_CG005113, isoform B [Clunio marinus]|uniref:CLUMA_CG005113, isoform B n=1 Tax=Clunio marinus TaxID=568069 RepID=A0A1J1HVQ2_9DIPT|nr:CLUMA_CG005113, isoform B [Clunio marinus]